MLPVQFADQPGVPGDVFESIGYVLGLLRIEPSGEGNYESGSRRI